MGNLALQPQITQIGLCKIADWLDTDKVKLALFGLGPQVSEGRPQLPFVISRRPIRTIQALGQLATLGHRQIRPTVARLRDHLAPQRPLETRPGLSL